MGCEEKTSIKLATMRSLEECSAILEESDLGQKYFVNNKGDYIGRELLEEGFNNNEISVLQVGEDSETVGFSWIQARGIFHWFPFLHVVAVSKKYRKLGYGSMLMEHFESLCRTDYKSDKAFLVVANKNIIAKGLYQRLGYKEVGSIPNLYIENADEVLMYKEIIK